MYVHSSPSPPSPPRRRCSLYRSAATAVLRSTERCVIAQHSKHDAGGEFGPWFWRGASAAPAEEREKWCIKRYPHASCATIISRRRVDKL